MRFRVGAILMWLALPGCVIVDLGVTNPIPELSTVAIAPFFNLSSDPTVDGRRFSAAYYSELQKVPGFQVVPIDITERAIIDNQLSMGNASEVLELAKILEVDAVVIGAVTDFKPYYPPRLGLQVSWYSPTHWEFYPGVQVDQFSRRRFTKGRRHPEDQIYEHPGEEAGTERASRVFRGVKRQFRRVRERVGDAVYRGQSPDPPHHVFANTPVMFQQLSAVNAPPIGPSEAPLPMDAVQPVAPLIKAAPPIEAVPPIRLPQPDLMMPNPDVTVPGQTVIPVVPVPGGAAVGPQDPTYVRPNLPRRIRIVPGYPLQPTAPLDYPQLPYDAGPLAEGYLVPAPGLQGGPDACRDCPSDSALLTGPLIELGPEPLTEPEFDPLQPFMSYTRLFDGTDAKLVANVRDYLEVHADQRSGGWEGYLSRTEDFIRFASHRMIVEMLTLHGGEGKRRIVFKLRKYK